MYFFNYYLPHPISFPVEKPWKFLVSTQFSFPNFVLLRGSPLSQDFWLILYVTFYAASLETISRLVFWSLSWLSQPAMFVPTWDSEIQRSTSWGFWDPVGKDPGTQIQKLKCKWQQVRQVILVNRLVLDHVTHLYVEQQEKDDRAKTQKG